MERDADSRSGGWLAHPNPLVRWGGRAWLLLGLVLVAWVAWEAAGRLRIVVFPLVLALFPAAVLQPVVDWLDRDRVPRSLPAFAATFGFVLVLLGILGLLGWQISTQLSGLTDQLQSTWDDVSSSLDGIPGLSGLDPSAVLGGGGSGDGASGGGSDAGSGGGSDAGSGGGSDGASGGGSSGPAAEDVGGLAAALAEGTVRFLAMLFLGLVALFFYLRDGDRIAAFLAHLFPPAHRGDARQVGRQAWNTVSGYIRGQTLVALFDGTLFAIGLLVIGVPLAIALGVIVFLGAFVPTVGSIIAGAIAVLVALVSEGVVTALITLALIVGIQQLEGNVLAPVVLGREVELHPLAILVAITAGAALLGPFGAIVAVPLAASAYHAASYVRAEVA